jgi:energy-converting hydrogenase A subunit M
LKKHKPWFDEENPKLLDQRKKVKLQWLQDQSEIKWDNMNNIRFEARGHFMIKKREYLKKNQSVLDKQYKNER